MSTIYFFRHGQAGSRDDYDKLSETGREQARLLGEFAARERLRFDQVRIGGLRRQKETAAIVLERLESAGLAAGGVSPDARWNEFDLDEVYDGIAPLIAAEDEGFRVEYEDVQRRIREGDGAIHRVWTPSDTRVVKAWIEGRYAEFKGESWAAFNARVRAACEALAGEANGGQAAVFTSATPVSILVAATLGSRNPVDVMKLAGAAINSNFTVLHWRGGEAHLVTFNAIPHLADPALRTFR